MTQALLARQKAVSAYRNLHLISDSRDSSKRDLIEMLLDGLAASLASARHGVTVGDVAKKSEGILRANRIVAGLAQALNPTLYPALAEELGAVYRYMLGQLNRAHVGNTALVLDELLGLAQILRNAFRPPQSF
jgi:flagellar biosynthetic protein FliS